MKLTNILQVIKQPNGEIIECYASGDEYFNWLHDKNGYIIIQNSKNGYYYYAEHVNGNLVPSNNIITKTTINNFFNGSVTIKDIKISSQIMKSKKLIYYSNTNPAPKKGIINNLVVFIRFSDDPEFANAISNYDNMFNNSTTNYNSMYNYFKETSYKKLSINATFYPLPSGTKVLSYVDSHPRDFYKPYNEVTNPIGYNDTNRADREHTLLENAVNFISNQVSPSLIIDADNDGNVDNVCFIVKGSPTAWNTLLWPHQWELYSKDVRVNGKRVCLYNFQLDEVLDVGVLCHEMSHSIGYPDLYHYSQDELSPVSVWDVMATDLNPPQHSGAYTKYRYGTWIKDIPEITTPGRYVLHPITSSTNNCYKIKSKLSSTEYFVLEYRKKLPPFENSLPGSGLLVYRINTSKDGKGNGGGPPDEVYVFRPNGTPTTNGDFLNANLSSDVNRTSIGGPSNPIFLSDGTDSGLKISNIGSSGDTISFNVCLDAFPNSDMSISQKIFYEPLYVNQTLTYELLVKNNGPDPAPNVKIIDYLPDDIQFISAKLRYKNCEYSNGIITCDLGTMYNGSSIAVDIKIKPLKIGKITNTAAVGSDIFDPDLSNDKETVTSTVMTKLTTGPVIKDSKAKDLIIIIENTNSTKTIVDIFINDLSKCKEKSRHKKVEITPNCTEVFVLNNPPLKYEIVFDKVEKGVFFWTSTREENYCSGLNRSNFISANTFNHKDFVDLDS